MNAESETNLTEDPKDEQEDVNDDDQPSTPKTEESPVIRKKQPSIKAVTEDYNPQSQPAVVLIQSSGSFSAKTLPLPSRPISTHSDNVANECIYDQLPASLNAKPPPGASNTMPKPTTIKVAPIITEAPEPNEPQQTGDETEDDDDDGKVDLSAEKQVGKEIAGEKKYGDINTHKVCTIITMILCGLILNVFAFTCLIPAFINSTKSKRKLVDEENLEEAERYAKRSLILNLIAVIVTFIVIFAVFVILLIAFGASGMYKV